MTKYLCRNNEPKKKAAQQLRYLEDSFSLMHVFTMSVWLEQLCLLCAVPHCIPVLITVLIQFNT